MRHTDGAGPNASTAALFLLFEPKQRPDRGAVIAAMEQIPLASVIHDPRAKGSPDSAASSHREFADHDWLEFLLAGLSFDLLGMAPGPYMNLPQDAQAIGFDSGFDPHSGEALALVPGPHIADDASSLPIVRAWLQLACDLVEKLGRVEAVCWGPARLVTPASMFLAGVRGWLSGGPFPALNLVATESAEDNRVQSRGLDYLIGQEVLLDATLSDDRIAAAKLLARLAHRLTGEGAVQDVRQLALEDGSAFVLTPSQSGTVLEVSRM
ncbi:hypothetical protein K3148_13785 [Qipengyuania aurantiaca]|uniref:DUF4261 domain-containing protein n=1 Tax=Qipengyuania aurantiaca TaxID=2867233 RepID=A0ABX8ZLL5_9SPHN|nr:hypothetical protein [Qipengyuania aurantiaca]QZD89844.1 hypothetical protein K3148_13785 [Qipengyuania aurantiaca]